MKLSQVNSPPASPAARADLGLICSTFFWSAYRPVLTRFIDSVQYGTRSLSVNPRPFSVKKALPFWRRIRS